MTMEVQTLTKLLKDKSKEDLIELIAVLTESDNKKSDKIIKDYAKNHSIARSKLLLVEEKVKAEWKKAKRIINDSNNYGGCDSQEEESAYRSLDEINELIQSHKVSWKLRQQLLNDMLQKNIYDNSGFTDGLVDSAHVLCQTKAEKLYFADLLNQEGSSYYKKYAASIYEELGEDEKYLEIRMAHLEYGSDYFDLARYYMDRNKADEALKVVKMGLKNAVGRLDEIYQYLYDSYVKINDVKALWDLYDHAMKDGRDKDTMLKLMYDYCKAQKDHEKQHELLLNLTLTASGCDVKKWYDKCKIELPSSIWEKHKKQLLNRMKKKNIHDYLTICFEQGNLMEILECVKNRANYRGFYNVDENHQYSKVLAKTYPQEILSLYRHEVASYVDQGGRENYRHAVSVLHEIHQLMIENKLEKDWTAYLTAFKIEHKRKRTLMELLDTF